MCSELCYMYLPCTTASVCNGSVVSVSSLLFFHQYLKRPLLISTAERLILPSTLNPSASGSFTLRAGLAGSAGLFAFHQHVQGGLRIFAAACTCVIWLRIFVPVFSCPYRQPARNSIFHLRFWRHLVAACLMLTVASGCADFGRSNRSLTWGFLRHP